MIPLIRLGRDTGFGEAALRHDYRVMETDRQIADSEGIRPGRKVALWGIGLMLLALIVVIIALALTGIYNPFEGTSTIGP